jgi:hypothetical protein
MAFQPAAGVWHLLDGPPEDHTLGETRAAIVRYVRANPNSTPKAIADGTHLSYENVRKTCPRMAGDGQLCVDANSRYRVPGTPAQENVPGVPGVPEPALTGKNAASHEGQTSLPAVPAHEEDARS